MLHARTDYDRIQDPARLEPSMLPKGSTPIAADEPVMLFRAQDVFMPDVLRVYAALLRAAGNEEMASCAEKHALRAEDWQIQNGSKRPDMPAGTARVFIG